MVYKLMGSDFFINNAVTGLNLSYSVLGKTITNFAIDKTAGGLFTSGSSIQSLNDDIGQLKKKNIGGIGNYVVEGIEEMNEDYINKVHSDLIQAIDALTQGNTETIQTEGHLAIKLTSLISLDLMRKFSQAQEFFCETLMKQGHSDYKTHQGTNVDKLRHDFKELLGDSYIEEEF